MNFERAGRSELAHPNRPKRVDARHNRELILQAARELSASGRGELHMDEIAARAGVGVGTVYRHFSDKGALIGTLVRERFDLFNTCLREAVADETVEPFAALVDVLRKTAESLADDSATRGALMRCGRHVLTWADAECPGLLNLCGVLVERAQDAGTLRADFEAAEIWMVICAACATMGNSENGWDWRRHMELALRGMRAAQCPAATTN
jgi:AcrR family transcriptional regulator